jgi:hypothetical protein
MLLGSNLGPTGGLVGGMSKKAMLPRAARARLRHSFDVAREGFQHPFTNIQYLIKAVAGVGGVALAVCARKSSYPTCSIQQFDGPLARAHARDVKSVTHSHGKLSGCSVYVGPTRGRWWVACPKRQPRPATTPNQTGALPHHTAGHRCEILSPRLTRLGSGAREALRLLGLRRADEGEVVGGMSKKAASPRHHHPVHL